MLSVNINTYPFYSEYIYAYLFALSCYSIKSSVQVQVSIMMMILGALVAAV